MTQINVFISHSWSYSGHYDTLAEWIFDQSWTLGQEPLQFEDFSVPKDNPIHYADSDQQLKDAIYARIVNSHVVVIPTGMYAQHSKWIKKEISGSREFRRPILAVDPWGQQRSASVVAAAATKSVGWNAQSVVSGIWHLVNTQ